MLKRDKCKKKPSHSQYSFNPSIFSHATDWIIRIAIKCIANRMDTFILYSVL